MHNMAFEITTDNKARGSVLPEGDRVFVRNMTLRGGQESYGSTGRIASIKSINMCEILM